MRVFSEQSTQRFNDFGKRGSSPTAFPKTARPFFALPPFTFQKNKVVKHFEVSAGHGDSAALREITRRWSFHRTRRGLRPSAFLCGIPFGFKDESGDPGRCFRKSHRHPRAQSKLSPQKQITKVTGARKEAGEEGEREGDEELSRKILIENIDFFCRWNKIRPVGQIMEIFGRVIWEEKIEGVSI